MQQQTMTNHDETPPGGDPVADAAAAAAATAAAAQTPPGDGATPPASGLIPDPADASATVPPVDPNAWLPEKFRVVKDGTAELDVEASSKKLAESYAALEKLKGGSLAPATIAEYAIAPSEKAGMTPEEMTAFVGEPMTQAFLTKAHALGMSNEQVSLVLNGYLEMAPELLQANAQLDADQARAELAKIWPDEATQNKNFAHVARAIKGYGTPNAELPGSAKRVFDKYGTDPDFIAFAANIGAEMKEDGQVSETGLPSGDDIEALMKGEAYRNASHPDHKKTTERVKAHFDRTYGTQAKR